MVLFLLDWFNVYVVIYKNGGFYFSFRFFWCNGQIICNGLREFEMGFSEGARVVWVFAV